MRFIADAMLGRLARWLRLMGYDVLYGDFEDDDIIAGRKGQNGVDTRQGPGKEGGQGRNSGYSHAQHRYKRPAAAAD